MPIPQLASENHKLGMLDGLRGLMALWVLLGHSCILTGFYIPVLSSPGDAVEGFMILSGFLMTYHYILREPKEPWGAWTTWTAFWTRRYFRITPLYFLVLIPTFLLMPRYVFWRSRLDQLHGTVLRFGGMPTLNWLNVFVHASYIYGLIPRYCSSLVIPDWSISLEMQFYFVFPFLMILSARIGWAWLSALCGGVWLVAHASGVSHSFVEPSPLYLSILWFLIGMLWASHFLKPARRNQFAIAGCALALLSVKLGSILSVFAFAAIIFISHPTIHRVRGLLSGRVSKFLANASYSVYLIHLLILTPTAYYLGAYTKLSSAGRFLIAASATALISYSLAKPLEVVEHLGHNFGKRLATKLSSVRAGARIDHVTE